MIPEESAENRVTSNGRLGVYRTGDGGATWELWSDGLPERARVVADRDTCREPDGAGHLREGECELLAEPAPRSQHEILQCVR